mmetsp:Transcript_25913/g.48845  ORF Transcript_25913/g.48845 Transcript_25913/m.48845 type:complete len:239 (+) Transcript_25913:4035-4751(+)
MVVDPISAAADHSPNLNVQGSSAHGPGVLLGGCAKVKPSALTIFRQVLIIVVALSNDDNFWEPLSTLRIFRVRLTLNGREADFSGTSVIHHVWPLFLEHHVIHQANSVLHSQNIVDVFNHSGDSYAILVRLDVSEIRALCYVHPNRGSKLGIVLVLCQPSIFHVVVAFAIPLHCRVTVEPPVVRHSQGGFTFKYDSSEGWRASLSAVGTTDEEVIFNDVPGAAGLEVLPDTDQNIALK